MPAPRAAAGASGRVRPAAAGAAGGPAYLGLDFGTSGARGIAVDAGGAVVADVRVGYDRQSCDVWAGALDAVLAELPADVKRALAAVCLDGTSSTAVLVDRDAAGPDGPLEALAPPFMYNDAMPAAAVAAVGAIAPPRHTVRAATSTLCKLVAWYQSPVWRAARRPLLLHQADWLLARLHGLGADGEGRTDFNNCLKLGYDPGSGAYPAWLEAQPYAAALPRVVEAPGTPFGPIAAAAAERWGINPGCAVCAGTTDSIAAFLSAGVDEPGDAVTSLGSTLAIKLLSTKRVDNADFGIYSHKLREGLWLVGGASNSGGAVLRQHFSDAELAELSARIDPARPSGLDYYPLPGPGERFPVADPGMQPRMGPVPEDRAAFLHGLLEGIARIERDGFRKLAELGSTPVKRIATAGGGANNGPWCRMRERLSGVPVTVSRHKEAAYGVAVLASKQGAVAL